MFERLVDAYPDHVQFAFRHFPLNSIHANAQKAAEAAQAAGVQGAFWDYHDLLFEAQDEWAGQDEAAARDTFIGFADQLGLDTAQFTQELDDGVYTDVVLASQDEAVALGMPGTPAVILDGQVFTGQQLPFDYDVWDSFISSEIQVRSLAEMQFDAPPEMVIDTDAIYLATVTMASGDSFVLELYPQSAPETVNSFVFLSEEGWFDGVTFHRVLPGFVAQTGDPTGTGRGGPGYTIPNEIDAELSHRDTGIVAMANSGPDTNGSQWYITLGDAEFLDGSYTIFGKVRDGLDVVLAITPRDPSQNPNAPTGDMIESIVIAVEE